MMGSSALEPSSCSLRIPVFPDDVAAIAQLDGDCFTRREERFVSGDVLEAFVRAAATDDRQQLWARIAVDMDGPCGFAFADPSHSRLTKLCVAPRARRRGVGRALVEAAVAALRDRKALSVSLFVRCDNAGARALYERCGFVGDAVVADHYGPGCDGARMLRDCF